MRLTKTQQAIYDLVRQRPRTTDELLANLWWVHPQDAPARSAIKAHIWCLNQRLKPCGERVRAPRGGNRVVKARYSKSGTSGDRERLAHYRLIKL